MTIKLSNRKNTRSLRNKLLLVLPFIGALHASAHLTYPSTRDFGTFTGMVPQSVTISGQSTKAYGWADGTDADWAKQDDQRYFKFTLQNTTTLTISVTALNANVFLPAFSLYSGVGHPATDPAHPDFDGSATTTAYLNSLSGPARKGAFDALHTFTIGNDDDPANNYFGSLITLTYIDNMADGTSANFGLATGINGDGNADGFVTKTMTLPAGVYTLAIGGANYYETSNTAQGFTVTVASIPEPSSALLTTIGGFITFVLCFVKRRRTA